jgi:hypothetical protein
MRRWGIILKWILKKQDEGVDWINVVEDKNKGGFF